MNDSKFLFFFFHGFLDLVETLMDRCHDVDGLRLHARKKQRLIPYLTDFIHYLLSPSATKSKL